MIPSVSIVIPTWNRAATLKKAVESALNQTLTPLEIVVCDDGSNDESENIVRNIQDSRIRWVSGARGGCPAIPRNRGIRESHGEWIAFLDSDDEWLPHKLEEQMKIARNHRALAIFANALRCVPDQSILGNVLTCEREKLTLDNILLDNEVICSSVLIHRGLLQKVGFFPEDLNLRGWEDYALWLRVASLTPWHYVRDPLLIYSDNPQETVRADLTNHALQRKRVLKDFLCWVGQRDRLSLPYYGLKVLIASLKRVLMKKLYEMSARLKKVFP
jgi:glycosyltransferase involved in cell wall biosynthesis